MAPVTHVSPAGTVHNATARARLVIMVMAARRSVHVAGIMNPVIQKLGNVGGVTLDGLAQGLRHTFIIYHNNKSHMFYIISKHCTKYIIKQGFSTVSGGFNYHISCYRVNTLSFGTFSSCVSAFENWELKTLPFGAYSCLYQAHNCAAIYWNHMMDCLPHACFNSAY